MRFKLCVLLLLLLMGKLKWCRVKVKPAGMGKQALKALVLLPGFITVFE
jgi:hypothetical protein